MLFQAINENIISRILHLSLQEKRNTTEIVFIDLISRF